MFNRLLSIEPRPGRRSRTVDLIVLTVGVGSIVAAIVMALAG